MADIDQAKWAEARERGRTSERAKAIETETVQRRDDALARHNSRVIDETFGEPRGEQTSAAGLGSLASERQQATADIAQGYAPGANVRDYTHGTSAGPLRAPADGQTGGVALEGQGSPALGSGRAETAEGVPLFDVGDRIAIRQPGAAPGAPPSHFTIPHPTTLVGAQGQDFGSSLLNPPESAHHDHEGVKAHTRRFMAALGAYARKVSVDVGGDEGKFLDMIRARS